MQAPSTIENEEEKENEEEESKDNEDPIYWEQKILPFDNVVSNSISIFFFLHDTSNFAI